MKITLEELNNKCKRLFIKYSYIITDDEYINILKRVAKKDYDDIDNIETVVENNIKKLEKKKLANCSNKDQVIGNYIKICLNSENDPGILKDQLNIFGEIIITLYKDYEYEDMINLIKNSSMLSDSLAKIYKNYASYIGTENADKLFTPLTQEFIDIYCDLNDIDIDDKAILNNDDKVFVNGTYEYRKAIQAFPLLNKSEELELGKRIKKGDLNARNRLVESNLRFVLKKARYYKDKGIPYDDLVQAGNEGLIEAASKYKPEKNFRFLTYANWYIMRNMQRIIANESHIVRIPVHAFEDFIKYEPIYQDLKNKLTREPYIDELMIAFNSTREKAKLFIQFHNDVDSYDVPMPSEDGNANKIDFIFDEEYNLEEEVLKHSLHEDIMKILNSDFISKKQKQAVLMRLGFINNREYSLDEIIKALDAHTKQNASNLVMRGLKNIKYVAEIMDLKSYYK